MFCVLRIGSEAYRLGFAHPGLALPFSGSVHAGPRPLSSHRPLRAHGTVMAETPGADDRVVADSRSDSSEMNVKGGEQVLLEVTVQVPHAVHAGARALYA